MFGIGYDHSKVKCGSDAQKCMLDIVTVTDLSVSAEEKVQVYISGAFHGNEVLGTQVAYYLIEYLASNFNKDPVITYLLKHREIIITPMTNAVGFYENKREEKTVMLHGGSVKYRDPNRDFPYNNKMTQCMNTIMGRTVYRLFVENLFVTSITFHGGTNVLSYCWGSRNHLLNRHEAAEAPDHVAFHDLGRAMVDEAGGDIA